ncbi:MAG TPA: hypothetical protein VK761_05575 [Solirubrobacteraceae bacterium]|nr:hypothetical protein [Solirubrobacteraceae bacterium]
MPGRVRAIADSEERAWVGALCLVAIVLCSVLVVLVAANRPTLLTPTSHANYFPHWMSGPLGGLMPWLTRGSKALKYLFSGALVLMYVCYALALRYVPRLRSRWAIAAVLAVHVVFLLSPPLALTDLFNYVNYGRMEAVHSLNPYTTIPILEPHNDPSYALSNWHQLLSPYGPLFTILTFVFVPLGVAATFWAIKALLMAASLGIVLLVWKSARLLGRDPVAAIVLVGLNPVVLVWGLGGDHNDFLMVFCIVLGFYLLLRARAGRRDAPAAGAAADGRIELASDAADRTAPASAVVPDAESWTGGPLAVRLHGWLLPLSGIEIAAGAAFVVATGIKASGGVLIPVVLAGLLRTPRRLTQVVLGMALATVLTAIASLAAFGLHIPDLSTQSSLVTNVSVPNLIGLAIGAGGETKALHDVLSVVLVLSILACCRQAWKHGTAITASGWASVALLVTLSWVLPWYVLWVLPMAALSSSRRLRATALAVGVYMIVAWAPASGYLWDAIGFHPEKTPLGRLHQRYVKELLD